MEQKYIDILNNFSLNNIPNLDVAVLGALELFQKEKVPNMKLDIYKKPLVVGSGNAEVTGRIIFEDFDAVFASESNYEKKIKSIKNIDGVVLISASGEKHAPIIAKTAKKLGLHVTLITNSVNSSASKELDQIHKYDEYIFPKNREPYTYNTSTYMGMILGFTKEDPVKIYKFIKENIDNLKFPDFSHYNKFYFIVPPQFSGIVRMLQIKFIELFGRMIARDIETSEYTKHATTIVPSDELFISFGSQNDILGEPKNRLNIALSHDVGYGAMMAIGYYIIGKIQESHPPYFKENIVEYTKEASKLFGSVINPIIE